MSEAGAAVIELSIVVPALNEQDNVGPLVEEVQRVVLDAGIGAEMIVVDDGSTDQTLARLLALARDRAWLRVLHRDQAMGQSAAMHAGVHAARGKLIAMLDADMQNDPADLLPMVERLRAGEADMIQGDRSHHRRDSRVRLFSSWVGRAARRLLLGDGIRDTGCTARVVRADIARQFPLQFKGMHRFMPVYAAMLGARVLEQPVNHRPRAAGEAKYGMLNRGPSGLLDCLAMRWMLRRYRDPAAIAPSLEAPREMTPGGGAVVSAAAPPRSYPCGGGDPT